MDADVTATGTRDPRFSVRHVIDNRVCEFPSDGVLDYSLGSIVATQGYGYSASEHMSYFGKRSFWPFYTMPTYWLLPPRQLGEITLKLRRPAVLKMVRVLNTCDSGLNDFATVRFHVDLLSEQKFPMWTARGRFGRRWGKAFKDAFAMPAFFERYGPSFEGVLEPDVVVPFGAGWVHVPVDCGRPASFVRVTADSFWALGCGLNEIQVYKRWESRPAHLSIVWCEAHPRFYKHAMVLYDLFIKFRPGGRAGGGGKDIAAARLALRNGFLNNALHFLGFE